MSQVSTRRIFKLTSLWLAALLCGALLASLFGYSPTAKAEGGWRDTGLTLPPNISTLSTCFDGTQPNVLLVANKYASDGPTGTSAYNWATGQQTRINPRPFDRCMPQTGMVFARDDASNTALRFSAREPQGRAIDFIPSEYAADGTAQLYALEYDKLTGGNRLYYSKDGGDTWEQRGQQFGGKIEQVAVAQVDARSVYALLAETADGQVKYAIYYSPDAGLTWEKRFEDRTNTFSNDPIDLFLYTPGGHNTPVTALELDIDKGSRGAGGTFEYFSIDGGRNFRQVGQDWIGGSADLFYTTEGLTRFSRDDASYNLELSSDGGASWQNLPLPYTPSPEDISQDIYHVVRLVDNAPANLLLYTAAAGANAGSPDADRDLWQSPDGGKSWRKLGKKPHRLLVSPNAPLTLLGIQDNRLYAFDLPEADRSQTRGVEANNIPGGSYFPETRHNLSGPFKAYWLANGGLAQFGYPQTEPFREYNPADGKVYLVQYFERNRFEYHPENAGTKYEVLLGLLGNQLTEQRHQQGEQAFKRSLNANAPGNTYFQETGHNLSGPFKVYWEAHGGLALYGFPISEEFEEVNPDDGQTYTVQYFERNRFEYHPENKGSQYEVLLGLLGNSLLKQKGWR